MINYFYLFLQPPRILYFIFFPKLFVFIQIAVLNSVFSNCNNSFASDL